MSERSSTSPDGPGTGPAGPRGVRRAPESGHAGAHAGRGGAGSFWGPRTAASAIFVAMAAALGYVLLAVPNVELVTFTVFASGVALGKWRGALVGALATAIYSGFNPYGSGLGVPTMFAGQMLASAIAGFSGGLVGPLWRRESKSAVGSRGRLALISGGLGLLLTGLYQSAVIIGLAAASPEFRTGALAVIISNAFFSVVHLASNTVVFAVLGPTVLPRVVRMATLRFAVLTLSLLVLVAPTLAVADDAPRNTDTPGGAAQAGEESAEAQADTTAEMASDREPPIEVPRFAPGGDVRRVRVTGATSSPDAPRALRLVGSGMLGHRLSAAWGALPPTLTRVTVRGRPAADWAEGGLDLLSASSPAHGALLAPGGADLSIWPMWTSEWAAWRETGTSPISVALAPVRRPEAVPYSRVTALTGSYGGSAFAAEFGRRFAGDMGLSGFAESEKGDSPFRDGGYEHVRTGGSAIAYLDGGWTAEIGGFRFSTDRSRPVAGESDLALPFNSIRSDYFLRGMSDDLHIEFSHTQSWLEDGSTGPALRTARDALFLSAASPPGPADRVVLELSRREATGGLVDEADDAVGVRVEAARSARLMNLDASITAGLSTLDGDVLPLARASVRDSSHGWSVDAGIFGRHVTALERLLIPRALPGGDGITLSGNADLEPERAVAIGASWENAELFGGVGVRGQLARVIDPLVLAMASPSLSRPENAADESGGALSLWADFGDTARVLGTLDVVATFIDGGGPLNANMPVPRTSVRATTSVPLSLFERYVRVRLEVGVVHEQGLARGPWRDLLDDSRVSVTARTTGEIGSARLYAALENLFSTDSARVPGMDPGDRVLTLGFSWRFLD